MGETFIRSVVDEDIIDYITNQLMKGYVEIFRIED